MCLDPNWPDLPPVLILLAVILRFNLENWSFFRPNTISVAQLKQITRNEAIRRFFVTLLTLHLRITKFIILGILLPVLRSFPCVCDSSS